MKTLIKGITSDSLLNIELTETKFSIIDKVPFDSDLGRDIINKHGLEWLYNNRYLGVSALDCVVDFAIRNSVILLSDSKIRLHDFVDLGVCMKRYGNISLEKVKENLERHSGTLQHFSEPKILGYAVDYMGTNLLFDVLVDNDSASVQQIHCNKMNKTRSDSNSFVNWQKDKENFKGDIFTGDSFLLCIEDYFSKIVRDTMPIHIQERDSEYFAKLSDNLKQRLNKQQI